ncbi:MAG: FG-GAP repeat protein [Deltaproteobacteria bacterium]|nr:FG-GAP repeat protein [Deltaproteobacteria bacterium]
MDPTTVPAAPEVDGNRSAFSGGDLTGWYRNTAAGLDQGFTILGASAATAGDVNGDGYTDVIVGSKDYNKVFTDEGMVYVYYGNASKGVGLRPHQAFAITRILAFSPVI